MKQWCRARAAAYSIIVIHASPHAGKAWEAGRRASTGRNRRYPVTRDGRVRLPVRQYRHQPREMILRDDNEVVGGPTEHYISMTMAAVPRENTPRISEADLSSRCRSYSIPGYPDEGIPEHACGLATPEAGYCVSIDQPPRNTPEFLRITAPVRLPQLHRRYRGPRYPRVASRDGFGGEGVYGARVRWRGKQREGTKRPLKLHDGFCAQDGNRCVGWDGRWRRWDKGRASSGTIIDSL